MARKCSFCERNVKTLDPMDPILKEFLTDSGKILPRKATGLCSKHQRMMTKAIKQARNLGILPYTLL